MVIASDFGDNLRYYKCLGGTNFQLAQSISLNGVTSVQIDDIDNDGDLDLIAGTLSNLVSTFENDGFDLDGDLDIYYVSLNEDYAAWQENLGQGNFAPAQILTSGLSLSHFLASTVSNGDGLPDTLINNTTADEVVWIPNLGNGNFGAQQQAISIPSPYNIETADIDGDGVEDLIVTSYLSDNIVWCKNLSNGTFDTPQNIAFSIDNPKDIAFVDDDNDGDLDVIFSCTNDNIIGFAENDGNGNFSPHVVISNTVGTIEFIELVDMDYDGLKDIVYISSSLDELGWMRSTGFYTWDTPTTLALVSSSIYDLKIGHIDDNGYPDIVYTSLQPNASKWVKNAGNGNFGFPLSITNTNLNRSLTLYDMDGDTDLDVVTGQGSGIVWIENTFTYPNKLSGTVFFDGNQNGIRDPSELGLNVLPTSISPTSISSYTTNDGSYFYAVPPGTYDVIHIPLPDSMWSYQTPTSYTRTISTTSPNHDSLDFGYYPDSLIKMTSTHLVGGFPRCNDTVGYTSMVKNIGSTMPSGYIHLILDDSVSLVQTFTTPDSKIGQNIYWSVDSLFYFDVSEFKYELHLPDFQSMGDTITNEMYFYGLDTSGTIIDTGYYKLEQILVCAYDPNDKSVYPKGDGPEGFVANDQYLEYLVRLINKQGEGIGTKRILLKR